MRVAIIGAGPAGLFAALELSRVKKIRVTIFEKGLSLDKRIREYRKDYIHGVGGAGLFSDGKLNFSPVVGGNLYEFLERREAEELLKYIERIFREIGVKVSEKDKNKIDWLTKKAIRAGIKFVPIKQAHIGSNKLPEVIAKLVNEIVKSGVKMLTETEVKDLSKSSGKILLSVCRDGKTSRLKFDRVLIAVGRAGFNWFEKISRKLGIEARYEAVDLGVRVEVPTAVMEDVIRVNWDPKFHIYTKTYDDFVRTFCTCPDGYVVSETHEEYVLVNGYSNIGVKSGNTNFALLTRIRLTEPVENANSYGESIARLATTIGGGKPIIQRLIDLRNGRRSTWPRIEKSYVNPTLREATPGDISMAMPHRIVTDTLEALEKLDRVIPGVANDSTLLYAPEIKFYALKVLTNRDLESSVKGIFVAGDGAGISRGIIGAAATGIIAARGIVKSMS